MIELYIFCGRKTIIVRDREIYERRERKFVGVRGNLDTGRIWYTKSTKQGSYGLTDTEMERTGPARICVFVLALIVLLLWDS